MIEIKKLVKNYFDKFLLFVIVFTIAYNSFHVFILKPDFITHDEGNYIYSSWRVSEGEVPYKDFFDHHISGSYFLLGGVFKIFGASMNVARALMVLVCALTTIFVFLIAKKLTSKLLALIAVTPFILLQPSFKASWFYLDSFVALFATASAYFIIKVLLTNNNDNNKNTNNMLFLSGALASLAVLFKQNAGFFWFFLVLFVIFYLKKEKKPLLSKNFFYFIFGLSIPLLIYLSYLIITKTFGLAFDYLFLLSFTNVNNSVGREFPYGFDFYLAISPLILALVVSIFIYKSLKKELKYVVIFIDLWLISTVLLLYPLLHPFHAYPALAPSFILIVLGFKALFKKSQSISKSNSIKFSKKKLCTIFVLILLLAMPLMSITFNYIICPDNEIPGSSEVVLFLKENTKKEDKILVLSFDPQIYFLSKRRASGKYQYIHRVFHTESIEKEVVESCKKEDVKFIVWGFGYNKTTIKGTGYKNLNFELHELKIINSYIKRNFSLIVSYGNFLIFALNDISM